MGSSRVLPAWVAATTAQRQQCQLSCSWAPSEWILVPHLLVHTYLEQGYACSGKGSPGWGSSIFLTPLSPPPPNILLCYLTPVSGEGQWRASPAAAQVPRWGDRSTIPVVPCTPQIHWLYAARFLWQDRGSAELPLPCWRLPAGGILVLPHNRHLEQVSCLTLPWLWYFLCHMGRIWQ